MTPDWGPLDRELARLDAAGLTLPLWWRDDDAVSETPQLQRLTGLSAQLDLPVHLAVIPKAADETLASHVVAHPFLVPVVHGCSHRNYAPQGEKKAEFGGHRPVAQMADEAQLGLTRLVAMWGDRVAPMFVPPWNRVSGDLIARLPGIGFTTLSTFTTRKSVLAAPGLTQVNTHLDPINWRGDRSLFAPDMLIRQISDQLADRRLGRADASEPFGILTHHLVHDAAIWNFTERLLTRLLAGPVSRWTAPMQMQKDNTA